MVVFDVLDSDGFVVRTFPTLDEAKQEIAATDAEFAAKDPLAVKEGNRVWRQIRQRDLDDNPTGEIRRDAHGDIAGLVS